MKRLLLLAVFVLAACEPSGGAATDSGTSVFYYHDDAHEVSCWLYGSNVNAGKAISCLPDSQVSR